MASTPTVRELAKAQRREAILREAARLFADQGFSAVTIEELGAAVGVSGPAVYRHFAGKQAVLAELLVGVSRALHDGGAQVADLSLLPEERLRALIAFHVQFAVRQPEVIRVQDRDLNELAADELRAVRRWQRAYVEAWVSVLDEALPGTPIALRRLRVQAAFGLMNATPHALRTASGVSASEAVAELCAMAAAALGLRPAVPSRGTQQRSSP